MKKTLIYIFIILRFNSILLSQMHLSPLDNTLPLEPNYTMTPLVTKEKPVTQEDIVTQEDVNNAFKKQYKGVYDVNFSRERYPDLRWTPNSYDLEAVRKRDQSIGEKAMDIVSENIQNITENEDKSNTELNSNINYNSENIEKESSKTKEEGIVYLTSLFILLVLFSIFFLFIHLFFKFIKRKSINFENISRK